MLYAVPYIKKLKNLMRTLKENIFYCSKFIIGSILLCMFITIVTFGYGKSLWDTYITYFVSL